MSVRKPVTTGLERLGAEGLCLAGLERGARLGLLAHPASVDGRGVHAVQRLSTLDGAQVVRIFAPEHGLWGHEQDMESVTEGADPETGLPVVSLYGENVASLAPAAESLAGLDAVVCDLQDVGARYYTFIYTLSYLMEVAGRAGLPVIVLDRPNPIGGDLVEGPVLDPSLSSFVGRYPLPVRHGMTIGELATLFKRHFGVDCDLRVVRLEGWLREMSHEATGLPWIPPSPNMPALSTARVYPGGCLVEGSNLSEGRGTTLPFELVGAPWLPPGELARAMTRLGLPGVFFRAASFRPMFQKHAGCGCGGVQVLVDDPSSFRPFATYLALLAEARRLAGDDFAWRTEVYEFEADRLAIDLLLGNHELRPLIEGGAPLQEIEASWQDDLEEFLELREAFLFY